LLLAKGLFGLERRGTGIRQLNIEGAAIWEEFSDVEYHRVFSVPQSIDT
jgi:hypothetical protein